MKCSSSPVKHGRVLAEPYQHGTKPERRIKQSELDEILARKTAEAFEAGFREGSAKGYELGEREGSQRAAEDVAARFRQEFADKFAVVDGVIAELTAARKWLMQSAKQEVAALAVMIASRVLHREVEASSVAPELIEEAVRAALDRKHVVIRLNPADRAVLTQDGTPLEAMFPGAASVEFVDDGSVTRCGCVVETAMGIVDAQLDKQIEELRQALLA
jgi:flagellar biosynthesis/type III secretory pathway protein FliH